MQQINKDRLGEHDDSTNQSEVNQTGQQGELAVV